MSDDFKGLDFAAGVVTGARSFRVDKLGRLTGVNFRYVWQPGENIAECHAKDNTSFNVTLNYTNFSKAIAQQMSAYAYGGYIGTISKPKVTPPKPTSLQRLLRLKPIAVAPSEYVAPQLPEPEIVVEPVVPEPVADTMDNCGHGFYAYYDGSNDYNEDGMVSGVVEGYGECVVGERGFRAMKARIVALYISNKVSAPVALLVSRNYPDIPQFDSFRDMIRAFPTDGGRPTITPDNTDDFWTRST